MPNDLAGNLKETQKIKNQRNIKIISIALYSENLEISY